MMFREKMQTKQKHVIFSAWNKLWNPECEAATGPNYDGLELFSFSMELMLSS